MTPPKTENLKISFQRGPLNQGCVKGDGSIRLDGTSITIDAEWAGISWNKEARTIFYREMMQLKHTKDGFSIRLCNKGTGGITKAVQMISDKRAEEKTREKKPH